MNIAVIGIGYVGLVTAACFANSGNNVWCADIDQNKILKLKKGVITIYEPGLENLVIKNHEQGRLKFTNSIKEALSHADVCFISVGTPMGEDGSADLKHVLDVAKKIGQYMNKHIYVVNKSTVPVGTAEKVRREIQRQIEIRNLEFTFDVISNPEFLREGVAINDCTNPSRVIIGTDNEQAINVLKEIYLPYVKNIEDFIIMDISSAEMTKYAANAMLATKISFVNEIANICEKVGADIKKVRIGIGSDPRIGYQFINAGCGYGGSCFPKDVRALVHTAQGQKYTPELLKAVEAVNNRQKNVIPKKIINIYGEDLRTFTFAVWGLAFKPDTDDMRESSAITIINDLTKRGATIQAYDPRAVKEAKECYLKDNKNIQYYESKYSALKDADALILITEWKEFRSPDFHEIVKLLKTPIIFDGRNQYDKTSVKKYGIQHFQIGVSDL